MLQKSNERQVGTTLDDIREDHRERYLWVRERLEKNDNVLDAGCGVGYGSHLLAEAVASVHAIDISSDVIDFARRYWGRNNITYDVQDIHFLSFPAHSQFDVVVAMEIIEHMIEPRLFLMRAREVLIPRGKLYLSVPNEKIIPHSIDLNPYHIRHFNLSEITDLLYECGFSLKAYYGQDAKVITVGTEGRFLIIEAVAEKQSEEVTGRYIELSKEAVSSGAQLIVARANVLSKAKKDLNSLKKRLEEVIEISKSASSSTSVNEANVISLITSFGARIQSTEDALASEVRHRSHMLEISERNLRDALSAVQWQISRLAGC